MKLMLNNKPQSHELSLSVTWDVPHPYRVQPSLKVKDSHDIGPSLSDPRRLFLGAYVNQH